jgi:hypothetical protein
MHETARYIRSGRENNEIPGKRPAFPEALRNSDETAAAE